MGKQIAKKISIWVTVFGLSLIIFPISNFSLSIFYYHYTLQPIQYFFILFSIIIGVGILLLKEWARKLVIIFAGLMIFVSLAMFVATPEIIYITNFNLRTIIYMGIYGGLLLFFFTHPKVKEQFRK